jgi:hypothetical protein
LLAGQHNLVGTFPVELAQPAISFIRVHRIHPLKRTDECSLFVLESQEKSQRRGMRKCGA